MKFWLLFLICFVITVKLDWYLMEMNSVKGTGTTENEKKAKKKPA